MNNLIKKSVQFIPFYLVVFISAYTYAQDTIITKTNDTIACRINKMDTAKIYFQIISHKQLVETFLSIDEVQIIKMLVAPDNKTRIFYENKIMQAQERINAGTALLLVGGLGNIITLATIGSLDFSQGMFIYRLNNGMTKTSRNVIFISSAVMISGGILRITGKATQKHYTQKLQKLYSPD